MDRKGLVIPALDSAANLKRKLRRHLKNLGFERSKEDGTLILPDQGKDLVRLLHQKQRYQRTLKQNAFVNQRLVELASYFAAGPDIIPARIAPRLEKVASGTWQSDLFKLASLTWSVPVSSGFGRRLRYLVWDDSNDKLIGILAIGDPVFNLGVRDQAIGWSGKQRIETLVNTMDAYVLGAIPPYNQLLAGKLVACLLRTREVYDDFNAVYGDRPGIISGKAKRARLVAITTSSSMGRSSVYNRLKLGDVAYLRSIGYSSGWGHFHIPDRLFQELRDYLRDYHDHRYADQHAFGKGPNWRMRTTKAALVKLGFNPHMLRHGVQREVFVCELARNANEVLRGETTDIDTSDLLSVAEVSGLALERWILPRAIRMPAFAQWRREDLAALILNRPSLGLTQSIVAFGNAVSR